MFAWNFGSKEICGECYSLAQMNNKIALNPNRNKIVANLMWFQIDEKNDEEITIANNVVHICIWLWTKLDKLNGNSELSNKHRSRNVIVFFFQK